MNEELILLDVNVPMYAAGGEHPYREACVWVMTQVAEGHLAVAIDTEIVQEVLYRYSYLRRWEIAIQMAKNLLELVPIILPVLPEDARLAVRLFEQYAPQGIPPRDIVHVAVMQTNGLKTILSTDTHFDRIEGIVHQDPLRSYIEHGQ